MLQPHVRAGHFHARPIPSGDYAWALFRQADDSARCLLLLDAKA